MYVMKITERAYVDYEFEVEIDDDDAREFNAGILTDNDLKSRYAEEICDARELIDLNGWGASIADNDVEIEEE